MACFNPCFNGFTTLTGVKMKDITVGEASFNPCFNGFTTLTFAKRLMNEFQQSTVSILVLMDSLL